MEKLHALYEAEDGRIFSDSASKSDPFNVLLDVIKEAMMFQSNLTIVVRTPVSCE
jgi:hypothetical protein